VKAETPWSLIVVFYNTLDLPCINAFSALQKRKTEAPHTKKQRLQGTQPKLEEEPKECIWLDIGNDQHENYEAESGYELSAKQNYERLS